MNLTVHIQFPNSTGNQLGILRSEIQDENGFLHGAKDSTTYNVPGEMNASRYPIGFQQKCDASSLSDHIFSGVYYIAHKFLFQFK